MAIENRVYKFGCRAPDQPELAEQILGQAWLYRDELRRIYNAQKRDARALLDAKDDSSHVFSWLHDCLNEQIRGARGRRGHLLDAGTYWLIEASVLAASKASKLDPIKTQHWDGTGRIGAEIQSTTQFPAAEWEHKRVDLTTPNEKRHATLMIRVGPLPRRRKGQMAVGRSIAWPIKLHRPFPEGALVKQVAVQRTRVGHRFRWEALVTIAYECERFDARAEGVVGVDLGWRSDGELGMRVATHHGTDDDEGVLHIGTHLKFEYSDAVRGTRDLVFDEAKEYVASAGVPGGEHARLWRDKERMRRLARQGELGAAMWNERDKHLEDIECGVRERAIGRRRDAYRVYADKLAKRYRYVVLEDMPMEDWVGEAPTSGLERRRSTAALYLLQMTLAQRFGLDRTDWAPSRNTSRTCSACGHVRSETVGPQAHWTCAGCDVNHHQDENAAKILRMDGERWIGGGNPPRARKRKASKGKGKRELRDVATGDELEMVVTARGSVSEAAE